MPRNAPVPDKPQEVHGASKQALAHLSAQDSQRCRCGACIPGDSRQGTATPRRAPGFWDGAGAGSAGRNTPYPLTSTCPGPLPHIPTQKSRCPVWAPPWHPTSQTEKKEPHNGDNLAFSFFSRFRLTREHVVGGAWVTSPFQILTAQDNFGPELPTLSLGSEPPSCMCRPRPLPGKGPLDGWTIQLSPIPRLNLDHVGQLTLLSA